MTICPGFYVTRPLSFGMTSKERRGKEGGGAQKDDTFVRVVG